MIINKMIFYADVVSNSNPMPRLNPLMVVEPPRVTASTAPTSPNAVQPSTVTIQSYVIPQGEWC